MYRGFVTHRPLTPEWIGEGSAAGVDDRRRSKFDAAAADGDIPALEVDLVVMSGAQQTAIAHRGDAAVNPVQDVVGVA
jgi:hypothetical protein